MQTLVSLARPNSAEHDIRELVGALGIREAEFKPTLGFLGTTFTWDGKVVVYYPEGMKLDPVAARVVLAGDYRRILELYKLASNSAANGLLSSTRAVKCDPESELAFPTDSLFASIASSIPKYQYYPNNWETPANGRLVLVTGESANDAGIFGVVFSTKVEFEPLEEGSAIKTLIAAKDHRLPPSFQILFVRPLVIDDLWALGLQSGYSALIFAPGYAFLTSAPQNKRFISSLARGIWAEEIYHLCDRYAFFISHKRCTGKSPTVETYVKSSLLYDILGSLIYKEFVRSFLEILFSIRQLSDPLAFQMLKQDYQRANYDEFSIQDLRDLAIRDLIPALVVGASRDAEVLLQIYLNIFSDNPSLEPLKAYRMLSGYLSQHFSRVNEADFRTFFRRFYEETFTGQFKIAFEYSNALAGVVRAKVHGLTRKIQYSVAEYYNRSAWYIEI
ncbi:MAG: hypothetical protein NZO16_05340 [Deltaproteobacteria bacterium]|nr:hypothetical protein [Deltaproteobacteria bacterium]